MLNSASKGFVPFIIARRAVYYTWNVLLFDSVCHKFLFCALRANDVVAVGDESFPNHRSVASRADEARVVPIPALERDETGTTNAFLQWQFNQIGISFNFFTTTSLDTRRGKQKHFPESKQRTIQNLVQIMGVHLTLISRSNTPHFRFLRPK